MPVPAYIQQQPAVAARLEGADHVDIHSVTGELSLREFIAGFMNYRPVWMRFLFSLRNRVLVRLLRIRSDGDYEDTGRLRPEDISFTPGERVSIFPVREAVDGAYWIGGEDESHLSFDLCIVPEPLADTTRRYYAITIVRYNGWTGRVYFNLIRPFHCLIVRAAIRDAVRRRPAPSGPSAA
jgi:hypothetical protein